MSKGYKPIDRGPTHGPVMSNKQDRADAIYDSRTGKKLWPKDYWEPDFSKDPYKHLPEWDSKKLDQYSIDDLLGDTKLPGEEGYLEQEYEKVKHLDPTIEDPLYYQAEHQMPEDWYSSWLDAMRKEEEEDTHEWNNPGIWKGQEIVCVPALLRGMTDRTDTLTLCAGHAIRKGDKDVKEEPEFDWLEFLYAKDQEGKVIHIKRYHEHGTLQHTARYNFIPPKGTQSVTPYAGWKLRGVWRGQTIDWDENIENKEKMWFTDMNDEARDQLIEGPKEYSARAEEKLEFLRQMQEQDSGSDSD